MRIIRITASIALLLYFSIMIIQCMPVARSADTPGGYIRGYVLDEDGNRVPRANVTLWLDGRQWQLTKYIFSGTENPQLSGIANSQDNIFPGEGGFLFGFVYPGDYVLTAEKDGYNGTASVNVNGSTMRTAVIVPQEVPVNITLKGYHVPSLPAEQQDYTGAITGNIRTGSRLKAMGVNVSLWQDGRLVNRTDNPQASFERNYSEVVVDYLFEHVAPGNYTVMATYFAGDIYTDSVPVRVGVKPMRADIILTKFMNRPTEFPDYAITPTVGEFTPSWGIRNTPVPSPALSWIYVLLISGAVVGLMIRKNNRN